jgi:hypothetical protein
VGHRGERRLRAARERSDPRDKLGEREGLGQVIVGTEAKTVDAVVDRAGGGQHQHATAAASLDDSRAHLVAVEPRQVPVEHDDVIRDEERALQSGVTVESDVDRHLRTA